MARSTDGEAGTITGGDDQGDVYARQLATWRGQLPPSPLGARDLTQLARNPRCDRLLVHRAAQIDPATVAREVLHTDEPRQGSRLALATGVKFEHVLLREGARLLFDLFVGAGRLPSGVETLVNVQAAHPKADPSSLARRTALTHELLRRKLEGDPTAPVVIWHPRLALPVPGVVNGVVYIEPDFLVAAPTDAFYRPGEVKAYKDRGARTASTELTLARLQGALEVLALRATACAAAAASRSPLAAVTAQALVPMVFDLVLRRPSGMRPTLHPLAVRREGRRMETLLQSMRGRVLDVLDACGPALRLDAPGALQRIPNHLTEGCRDHCALAAACAAEARAQERPIVLGESMEEAVASAGSLPRLLALLEGQARPSTADERRVLRAFLNARARVNTEVRRAG